MSTMITTSIAKGKGKAAAEDSWGAKGSPVESVGPSHTKLKAQGSDEMSLAAAAPESEVDKLNRSLPITGASIRPAPPQTPTSAQDPRPPLLRLQDIKLPNMMDESACLRKLTTYSAYAFRKCPPRNPKEERRGTWARAEIYFLAWSQEDILEQIKKLGEKGQNVADKTKVLAPNMQNQIKTFVDDLVSRERDPAFEWSLVQLKQGETGGLYKTVTMTAFVKRSPRNELNPIILFERIERSKAELVQPLEPSHERMWILEVKSSGKNKVKGRSKSRQKKYHEHDDSSTGDSVDSDTGSHSSFKGSDSMDTSIPSMSRDYRRHSHSKGPLRVLNKPRPYGRRIYLDQPLDYSPDLPCDAYGRLTRPYEVPHVPPHAIYTAIPSLDPVAAAYHAGIDAEDTYRTMNGVIESRPVGAARYEGLTPRYPDYPDRRHRVDDLRRGNTLQWRDRDREEYRVDSRLDNQRESPRPLDFDRRDYFCDRRGRERTIRIDRDPFAPTQLPRRCPPRGDSNSGC